MGTNECRRSGVPCFNSGLSVPFKTDFTADQVTETMREVGLLVTLLRYLVEVLRYSLGRQPS